jgi:hypothetical protein
MRQTLISLFALVFLAPFAASAQVYQNPWNSGAIDAGAWSQTNQLLANEFSLVAGATVNRATWYGTMFSQDPLNTGDTWFFTTRFYNSTGGLPGGVLGSAAVTASVTETGTFIGGERAYLFDASFAGVALAAGTSYWFSIENTGTQNTFRWTEATSGMGSAYSINGSSWASWTEELRTPLNFTLYGDAGVAPVPEPETYAMMLAGLGLLGFMARRRKQQSPV